MSDSDTSLMLKKQMLMTRSALEREEMVRAIHATSQSTLFLRSHLPGMALARSLPLAVNLMQRARVLAPILPFIWAGVRRPLLRYTLLGGVAALLAWRAGRWVVESLGISDISAADRSGLSDLD